MKSTLFPIMLVAGLVSLESAGRETQRFSWKANTVTIEASLDDDFAECEFEYIDPTGQGVVFTNVFPDCFCTVVQVTKFKTSNGLSGLVQVRLEVSRLSGVVEKRVFVKRGDIIDQLTVRVKLPVLVTLNRQQVSWKLGEARTECAVTFDVQGQGSATLVQVVQGSDNFLASIEPLVQGQRYLLRITPVSTRFTERAVIETVWDYHSRLGSKYKFVTVVAQIEGTEQETVRR